MISIRDWLRRTYSDCPIFDAIDRHAQQALQDMEQVVENIDDGVARGWARGALDEIRTELGNLLSDGKRAAKACEDRDDEIANLHRVIEQLAQYLPHHVEIDEERAEEMLHWCDGTLRDWDYIRLGTGVMILLPNPSEQVLLKLACS